MEDETSGVLTQLAVDLHSKVPPMRIATTSGVVVAGFGAKDLFPALVEFEIDGVVNNQLIYWNRREADVSNENTAAIIPFAQGEMVYSFMEGVDPSYEAELEQVIHRRMTELPTRIFRQLNIKRPRRSKSQIEKVVDRLQTELEQELYRYRMNRFVAPILTVVGSLPKHELADMAESLVNLTSFRRRVSMDPETVGGPIDVAVISKGDGFIWIKRKYYFEARANPNFFQNYYREEE